MGGEKRKIHLIVVNKSKTDNKHENMLPFLDYMWRERSTLTYCCAINYQSGTLAQKINARAFRNSSQASRSFEMTSAQNMVVIEGIGGGGKRGAQYPQNKRQRR